MTVAELIVKLQEMPQDLPVVELDGMPVEHVGVADCRTIIGFQEVVIY